MQLPVDPQKLIIEAMRIEEARATPLSVSVYLDSSAPADMLACVRSAFASSLPTVRMTVSYVGEPGAVPHPLDDFAVIAAGLSEEVGRLARRVRKAGVPVMVVTTLPSLVAEIAEASGCPVPEGDLVSTRTLKGLRIFALPATLSQSASTAAGHVAAAAERLSDRVPVASCVARAARAAAACPFEVRMRVDVGAGSPSEAPAESESEPYLFDDEAKRALDLRMGQWIVAVCASKRLACALAFPCARRPLALDAVGSTSLENAGVGALPIVLGADLPIMTLNQAKMILQIAAAYGQPVGYERAKEVAAVVGNALLCRAAARELVALVPGFGAAVRASVGYAGTAALGHAAIEYFEGGSSVAGLTSMLARTGGEGARLAERLRAGFDALRGGAGAVGGAAAAAGAGAAAGAAAGADAPSGSVAK